MYLPPFFFSKVYDHNPSLVVLVFQVFFHFLPFLEFDHLFSSWVQILAKRARCYLATSKPPGIELDELFKLKSEVTISSLF